MIRIEGEWPKIRCIIFQRHIHHFWFGLMISAGGLVWAFTDWADRNDWIPDLICKWESDRVESDHRSRAALH